MKEQKMHLSVKCTKNLYDGLDGVFRRIYNNGQKLYKKKEKKIPKILKTKTDSLQT